MFSKTLLRLLCGDNCPKITIQSRGLTLREKANSPASSDLYEPRFEVKRYYPDVEMINVKLRAYDFQPLEKFQAFVHWTARQFSINVIESYPLAHKAERIREYKPGSSMALSEYELKTYFRVITLGPVPAIQIPLFVTFLQIHAPIGIHFTLKEHEASDESERYISDPQLEDFKETLRNLDDPIVRKYLGWEA